MAEGKWISDLEAETPLADAARRVLTVRLEVVRDYLPKALHEADKDPENVHQLRVGTRRAGAAVEIFARCLPDKIYRSARRQLRRVRRAAGEARDWDVFLLALMEWGDNAAEKCRPGVDYLHGYAMARRAAAQEHLCAAAPDEPFAFDRLLADVVSAVDQGDGAGPEETLIDLAQPLLAGLLKELDRAANQDLNDYENLHRVRIVGKRLRYAMEVFADCFAEGFREQMYPAVEEMQEILGLANDSYVGARRLGELRDRLRAAWPDEWKRVKFGVEALLRYHRRRLPQERKRFLKWWKRWQESGGETALGRLIRAPAA